MLQLATAIKLRAALSDYRRRGLRIGFVPTMGNLHAGHISLIEAAKQGCDFTVCSIFVNPLQFGPNEDFSRYPRTLDADQAKLVAAGCDAVFTPAVEEIYPLPLSEQTTVTVPQLSKLYCGKSRPGHFDGVCTVVCKLFNMVQPDVAYFGLKDFQQFFLIRRMVADLQLPIQLIGLPTVREASGLAMSSRNGFLDSSERLQASAIHATLQNIANQLIARESNHALLETQAGARLEAAGLRVDYFHIADAFTLLPAHSDCRHLVLLAAAWAGKTRLIDNLTVTLE